MRKNHRNLPHFSLPRLWLITDERVPREALLRAAATLALHAAIILRHYRTAPAERRALLRALRRVTRGRIPILLAGEPRRAVAWGADGHHGPRHGPSRAPRGWIHSTPAHDGPELRHAQRIGADVVLLSPVFPTRSHPGATALGRVRFGLLRQQANLPVIALGGMTTQRARSLSALDIHGWAAIDGLTAAS